MLAYAAASQRQSAELIRRVFSRNATTTTLGFILVGPPGCGKGTIAKRLQRDFPVEIIGTGDLIRHEIRAQTDLGKKVKETVDNGGLVPDNMVNDMVRGYITELKKKQHWVLDGFPRTPAQAEFLDSFAPIHAVINVDVPFDTIVQRLSERLVHPPSGRIYNLSFNPPKEQNKDDETGEPLVQRDDDKPNVVRARLEEYQQSTAPVIDHYLNQDKVVTFTGTETNKIYPHIERYLQSIPKLKEAL